MRWTDVSMPLEAGMPAFPGDPVFRSTPVHRQSAGGPFDLSKLELGSHTGTHVDAPRHFVDGGVGVDRLALDALNGPALLLTVPDAAPRVTARELAPVPPGTERLLLRTSNSARWARHRSYFPDFVALDLSAARTLVERRVRLVGIDALSIEPAGTTTYPVHRELLGTGVVIVEGLLFAGTVDGPVELACWPLRLTDGDGAPARVAVGYP